MEVHHHSHGHSSKSWKNYIWEFVMLFLAVFCGSMAEYWLEHKIEKDREKQYITSLVADLKIDSTNVSLSITEFESSAKHFDTINKYIQHIQDSYNPTLLFSLKRIIGYRDFIPTDKTLQQLKNAGNLRLIRNVEVTDSIANYDLQLKKFQITSGELQTQFNKIFEDYQSLIYLEYKDSTALKTKYLITKDDAAFKKYHNHIKLFKRLKDLYVMRLQELKINTKNLLALLKKEYKIS